jgi:hypothetical protein
MGGRLLTCIYALQWLAWISQLRKCFQFWFISSICFHLLLRMLLNMLGKDERYRLCDCHFLRGEEEKRIKLVYLVKIVKLIEFYNIKVWHFYFCFQAIKYSLLYILSKKHRIVALMSEGCKSFLSCLFWQSSKMELLYP